MVAKQRDLAAGERGLQWAARSPAAVQGPNLAPALLLAADVIAVTAASAVPVGIWWLLGRMPAARDYVTLAPFLLLFLATQGVAGLYSSVGMNPVEELRRTVLSTAGFFLMIAASTFVLRGGQTHSRGIFFLAWALALVLVPVMRSLTRSLCARRCPWGYPAVILGGGHTCERLVQTLQENPGLGLRPVAVLEDDPSRRRPIHGVHVVGPLHMASTIAEKLSVRHAIVAMPSANRQKLVSVVKQHARDFPYLYLVPDLAGVPTLWTVALELGGSVGLEVRNQTLRKSQRAAKRLLDLVITILGGLIALPLILIIAVAIKIDSRGPVLFGHTRLGHGGRRFKVFKFRSMVGNAEKVLDDYLAAHPAQRREWEATQKLRHDPRVTFVGRILRRTSLDELPQLWNILKGEMSLVGPRPIVDDEVPRYGEAFGTYCRVRAGLTGLWQVSGRNDTTYRERVELDTYYVQNWSLWLDVYVLARTVAVVLGGRGAY